MAVHIPVLLSECLEYLISDPGGVYLDLTTGEGGHSMAIAEKIGAKGLLYCFDRDAEIQALAKENLKGYPQIKFVLKNFCELKDVVQPDSVSGILADLGISMFHYRESDKGFSFLKKDPLDMSLDGSHPNLSDIVHDFGEKEISDLIYRYGEERLSRKIAHYIVSYRKEKKIEDTAELAALIKKAVPANPEKRGFHPATKSFQAFRIYINKEFDNLEKMLADSLDVLKSGGRLVILTYHSLEDRIVKQFFKKRVEQGEIRLLNKKPLTADKEEVAKNPSARSAKLRAVEKISGGVVHV